MEGEKTGGKEREEWRKKGRRMSGFSLSQPVKPKHNP